MIYDFYNNEIEVRLNNSDGINERDIFINLFDIDFAEAQWIADSLYIITPVSKSEFNNIEIITIAQELDKISDIIDEEYDLLYNEMII